MKYHTITKNNIVGRYIITYVHCHPPLTSNLPPSSHTGTQHTPARRS
uniref:Uncharacterized protein n=1 Tax=Arundo donax TaxID=35708 RepID=A0A0A9BXI3_ARUDO